MARWAINHEKRTGVRVTPEALRVGSWACELLEALRAGVANLDETAVVRLPRRFRRYRRRRWSVRPEIKEFLHERFDGPRMRRLSEDAVALAALLRAVDAWERTSCS